MRYRANTKACAFRAATPPWRRAAQATRPILRAALVPRAQEAGGRGALFASSVSLTSPLRSEVPEKTKVATSISRSIPFHPVLIKPYVTGWNADASKSGRILRFFRRSTGREKPPRPYGVGHRTCRAAAFLRRTHREDQVNLWNEVGYDLF